MLRVVRLELLVNEFVGQDVRLGIRVFDCLEPRLGGATDA